MTRSRNPIRAAPDHEKRYPGADKLATEAVVNLFRAESLVTAVLAGVLRRYGLSIATFNVLMILEGAGRPLCPFEIGDRLLVTRGTVTGLLDTLQKQRLISRSTHPDDRRMLLVEATAKARELLAELLPEFFPTEAELMSALTAREKETLVRLLGKVQAHLDSRQPEPAIAGRAS